MIAKDLISDVVTPLKTSDTALYALSLMDEFKILHLPIVNNKQFLGLISESDIYNLNNPDEPIGNHKLTLTSPVIYQNQHIYEVIKLISFLKLTIVPVLDEKNNYLGVITLAKLVQNLSKIAAIENPGGIIILEINVNDYCLSQVVQIIESNDAKVLSLYIYPHSDSTKLDVIIKINRMDIDLILQTFDRYNYHVKASYSESDYKDNLKERYDSLMKYLNI